MRRLLAGVAMLFAAMLGPAAAHDIPEQIVLHGFVKPEGERLHFVVRVPLVMLLSLNLPKRGPGYMDLANIDDETVQSIAARTAKEIELHENSVLLKPGRMVARFSAVSDRTFETYEAALANIEGPKLPDSADVMWNQGYFDAHLEYPITSQQSDFSLSTRFAPGLASRVKFVVRFLPPDGSTRAYQLHGDAGHVMLDPRWHQAAWVFVKLGFLHILDGVDHLLFLVCLILPFRRLGWTLVAVITSFTVAHSITLIAAAYGIVPAGTWFPPLVEVLIATSILYMVIENLLRPNLERRWIVTFVFGLVHGFGFSFMLKSQLQFAGSHLLTSLLAFNVGIELGQLLVLAIALPVLVWLFGRVSIGEKALTLVLSLLVGHTAWHWLAERAQTLGNAEWPPASAWINAAIVALAALAVVGVVGWLIWRRAPTDTGAARQNTMGSAVDRDGSGV